MYIDSPFNTGQVFEHYDDNLDIWANLMNQRLRCLYNFLEANEMLWMHLDDMEVHCERSDKKEH